MRNVTSTSATASRNAEKFLPKILDRLGKAKAKAIAHIKPGDDPEVVLSRFKKIEDELQQMEDLKLLPRVTLWEHTLFSQFTILERLVDKLFFGDDESNPFNSLEAITSFLTCMIENVDQIKASIPVVKLMPSYPTRSLEFTHWSQPESGLTAAKKLSKELSPMGLEKRIYESRAMANLRRSYEHLEGTELRLCFLSFSIFPEESVIKKRPLIYWWIGEGFITATRDKTAEEVGEEIFGKLMKQGLIQPHGNVNLSTSCTLHPWIRCMLIGLARDALLFHFDSDWPWMPSCQVSLCRRACLVFDQNPTSPGEEDLFTVFNVNSNYLSFKREWLNKLKKVVVLQLGRWQSSPTHHIEVDDEGLFLKGIGAQHCLSFKYLSLRGISGITRIPSCIFTIISLEILDLRACHNLETLPSDISSLRKLAHLDISECYLLEGMPKGIGKLSSLQVLKGFLIANLKNTPSRLGDLAKLKKLRRLSIYIGNEAVMHDNEFETLKEISSLRRLKISWAVVSPELRGKIARQSLDFSFPPDLEKLDLQGIPLKEVPPWLNPRQLTNIKKLYIRGGELCSLDHAGEETVTECKWRVEILSLKYLSNMKIELPRVEDQFPHLLYLEIKKDINEEGIFWSKSQGQKLSKLSQSAKILQDSGPEDSVGNSDDSDDSIGAMIWHHNKHTFSWLQLISFVQFLFNSEE